MLAKYFIWLHTFFSVCWRQNTRMAYAPDKEQIGKTKIKPGKKRHTSSGAIGWKENFRVDLPFRNRPLLSNARVFLYPKWIKQPSLTFIKSEGLQKPPSEFFITPDDIEIWNTLREIWLFRNLFYHTFHIKMLEHPYNGFVNQLNVITTLRGFLRTLHSYVAYSTVLGVVRWPMQESVPAS